MGIIDLVDSGNVSKGKHVALAVDFFHRFVSFCSVHVSQHLFIHRTSFAFFTERHRFSFVSRLFFNTLRLSSVQGPDPSAVEASLNSIEFSLREFNTGSFPKGLSVMLSALNQVLHP